MPLRPFGSSDAIFFRKEQRIASIINQVLFHKYHVLSLLGSGRSSDVYLAEHIKLKTYRAIKRIPKSRPQSSSFLQEASLLKSLVHPGIPIIYDVEEDETSYYLIEEYIQGESFHAYVQNHDNISQETIISFGIQLCDIFEYLHKQPMPLFYLDLKPEHVILCGNQLKLIDFDIATMAYETGNVCQAYGSRGFAAPEQYENAHCGEQTDIYGIAALLYYMLTKKLLPPVPKANIAFPKYCSKKFKHIIQKASAYDMGERYQSVAQLRHELQKERMHQSRLTRHPHLLTNLLTKRKIIIAGSHRRIGSTHLAISLVAWLNHGGHAAFYEEKNPNGILGHLARYKAGFCEKDGVYRYGSFQALPGGSISQSGDVVQDYGSDLEAVCQEESQLLLLLVGSRAWEVEQAVKSYEMLSGEQNLQIICNYQDRQTAKGYAKIFRKKVYCFPLDEDPFSITREKSCLFQNLMKGGVSNQDK